MLRFSAQKQEHGQTLEIYDEQENYLIDSTPVVNSENVLTMKFHISWNA